MLHEERHKPVGDIVEERIALHLCKTCKIDVHALFLHIDNALHTGFKLLHPLLGNIGMQDFLKRVFLRFLNAVTGNLKRVVLDQIGHNLPADDIVVLLGIQRQYQLHLQFRQFLTHLVGLQHFINDGLLLRENIYQMTVQ